MATVASAEPGAWRRQAWVTTLMALVFVAGFATQLALGRSSFAAPPIVHAHALIFFGWLVLALAQSWLAATGRLAFHRPLGWLGAAWAGAMLVLGPWVTIAAVQQQRAPFFFTPQAFLVKDIASILCFALLTAAALALRQHSGWHRRLHLCALAAIMGPAFGRLLPMPLLIPWAFEVAALPALLFPAFLALAEAREDGRLHPAWLLGMAAIPAMLAAAHLLTSSALGDTAYAAVTRGTPMQGVPGRAYPPPPALPPPG